MRVYGVKYPNQEFIQPAANLRDASDRCGLDGVIYVRDEEHVSYDRGGYDHYGPWYRPHCEYCEEKGDLRELFGHLGCPHCWAEIAEASQDEIRWQQRHANDHKQQAA